MLTVNHCDRTLDLTDYYLLFGWAPFAEKAFDRYHKLYQKECIGSNTFFDWEKEFLIVLGIGAIFAAHDIKREDLKGGHCKTNDVYYAEHLECIIDALACKGVDMTPYLEFYDMIPGYTGIGHMAIKGDCLPFKIS